MDETQLNQLPRFSWNEIKKHLAERATFETLSPMGTALIRVREYQPLIGLAVHAGHQVREELALKMAIEEEERRCEEDYGIENLISGFPVQMIGLDSRYEYDVDRPSQEAIYLKPFQSWGKKVWNTPPSRDELAISHQKYDEFHELLTFIVGEISALQNKSLVLDVHSYNSKRVNTPHPSQTLPLFDMGTALVDSAKHAPVLHFFKTTLEKASLPNCAVRENAAFKGNGAIAKSIHDHCPNALAIPLEVKKIFWNEKRGSLDKNTLAALASHLCTVSRKTLEKLGEPAP